MGSRQLMKEKTFFVIIFLIMLLASHAALAAAPRDADPVIITASAVSFMHTLPVRSFGLFAFRDGKMKPIPFQIDEKSGQWNYVFQWGGGGKKMNQGRLSENDEIVFMSRDAGGRAAREKIKIPFDKAAEIKIHDPLTSADSWVYLLYSRRNALPVSKTDYVRVYDRGRIVRGDEYRVGASRATARKLPGVIDFLAIGKDGRDILDRLKFRARLTALGGTVKRGGNEEDARAEKTSGLDGRIRRIVRFTGPAALSFDKSERNFTHQHTFWPNGFSMPVYIDIPLDMSSIRAVVNDAWFRAALDFNPNARGMKLFTPRHRGILLDGEPSKYDHLINDSPFEWIIIAGEKDAILIRASTPPPEDFPLKLNCYYVDDTAAADPPEEVPGRFGGAGFSVANILDAVPGTYKAALHFYIIPDYRPGDEKRYLDILDRPLETSATQM